MLFVWIPSNTWGMWLLASLSHRTTNIAGLASEVKEMDLFISLWFIYYSLKSAFGREILVTFSRISKKKGASIRENTVDNMPLQTAGTTHSLFYSLSFRCCPRQNVIAPSNLKKQHNRECNVPPDVATNVLLWKPGLIWWGNVFPSPELKGEIFIKEYIKWAMTATRLLWKIQFVFINSHEHRGDNSEELGYWSCLLLVI